MPSGGGKSCRGGFSSQKLGIVGAATGFIPACPEAAPLACPAVRAGAGASTAAVTTPGSAIACETIAASQT